jgi:signal transduction protein with GAF and PtsI domain
MFQAPPSTSFPGSTCGKACGLSASIPCAGPAAGLRAPSGPGTIVPGKKTFDSYASIEYLRKMEQLSGISASSGIAIGRALLYLEDEAPEIPRYSIQKKDTAKEWQRFLTAAGEARGEVEALLAASSREMGKEHAEILEAHLMMLDDDEFQGQI